MRFLIFSGIVAFLSGVLLLLMPERLRSIEKKANKLMNEFISGIDYFIYKYNKGTGVCLLLSSATLFFVAYYLYKMY
ncbi:MAG: hypothetical protein KJ957_07155 [Candidatus Omnitrophica bacterium]|nr:hypothetical protein [Candidatus Omnitrophota bacterium]MBU1853802.1 hypothetical protein [Candidatus Omnitrophota bacterium]